MKNKKHVSLETVTHTHGYLVNRKGITLVSLIVTIIVMVILAGIALLFSVGDSGVISRAEKTQFLEDMKLYKEELELYKGERQIQNQKENEALNKGIGDDFNVEDGLTIKENYIPSMKRKYFGKLKIEKGKLVFISSGNAEEDAMAEAAGLEIEKINVKIAVEIQGEGTVEGLPENGEALRGEIINLKAIPGEAKAGETTVKYEFAGWYENGEQVKKTEDYSFEASEDRQLVAKFKTNATLIYLEDGSIDLNTNMIISGYQNDLTITKVEIQDGVEIAARAFEGCTNLETVTIGDDVTIRAGGISFNDANYKNAGTFSSCTSLKTVTMGERIKLPRYTYSANVYCYQYRFANCPNLRTVTIGSISGEEVGQSVFKSVGSVLQGKIKINEGVKTIGVSAFEGCTGITNLMLPNSLKSIGTSAFSGCTNLSIENYPTGITNYGNTCFYNCKKLTNDIEIKTGITLGSQAFNGSGIKNLVIGNGVEITARAFEGCENLLTLTIGDDVTIHAGGISFNDANYKKAGTFSSCTSLTTVTMGERIKLPRYTYSANAYCYQYRFANCPNLRTVTIGSISGEEVGQSVFKSVGSVLQGKIKINEGVKIINGSAFEGCTGITNLELPNSLTTIGVSAFSGCTNLSIENYPTGITNYGNTCFYNCKKLTNDIEIKTGTTLGSRAFNGSGIKNLVIGNGVEITARAFEGCENLLTLTIGDDVTIHAGGISFYDANYKNAGTFSSCTSLTTVTMGERIKLPRYTYSSNDLSSQYRFANCPNLQTVKIGSISGEEVGQSAFASVGSALQGTIKINEGVKIINGNAFVGCTGIIKLELPNSLTTIGASAFSGCTGITNIDIDMTEEKFNSISKGSNWDKGVTLIRNYK